MVNYTIEDIKKFINNMEKNSLIRMKESIKFIPFIGTELYKKALFEQVKINVFKKMINEAENGTFEEQQKLIHEFTPILSRTKRRKIR